MSTPRPQKDDDRRNSLAVPGEAARRRNADEVNSGEAHSAEANPGRQELDGQDIDGKDIDGKDLDEQDIDGKGPAEQGPYGQDGVEAAAGEPSARNALRDRASVAGHAMPLAPEEAPEESGPGRGGAESCPDVYAGWVDLVERIRTSQTDGMAELYELFSKGIRFYLCRQLGPQELDDKVHDTFVVVVLAIRRGELREPQRLMGFVRTIVRRQVAAHIDKVVHDRRDQQDMESTIRIADPRGNPEDAAMFRQRNELIQKVLHELGTRDREILNRFYLLEETQEQICSEMSLSETQFRLLKSRAKARFGELGKKKLAGRALQSVYTRTSAAASH